MPLAQDLTKFTTAAQSIASFDFDSLATGINYKTFYTLITQDVATQYSLQDNTINYSYIRDTTQSGNGTKTLTFDSSGFNIPRTVKGTAFISIGTERNTGAGDNTFTARLYKYDGSSATPISSTSTLTFGAVTDQKVISFEMPCTETLIAEGEQLRLVLTVTVASGAGTFASIGHDPANLDGGRIIPSTNDTITSTRINVPFKIE